MEQLYTLAEVAQRIKRPVATVRYWRTIGFGPRMFTIGNRVMCRAAELERWIEEQEAQSA